MKIPQFILLSTLFFINTAFAQGDLSGFMTPRDMLSDGSANISLQNNRNVDVTAYGLYVRQYAYVTPGGSCDSATLIYTGDTTAGSTVTPIVVKAGKSVTVGSNFLYNMILTAIYYENIIIPSAPPGCSLPGCTWGSDAVKYNWCIYLGALAPQASGYSSNVPPAADAASGGGYDYNLISTYHYIGPISCNDQTLTCAAATPQTQSFS